MNEIAGWERNAILAKLSVSERKSFAAQFKEITLTLRDVLHEQHGNIERVYFPLSGMISILLITESGEAIETGVVGREGVIGGSVIAAGDISFAQHLVQMGGEAITIPTASLRKICSENQKLRTAINGYQSIILLQAQQSAACHALHSISERLCRWLLHSQDIADSHEFFLTQEFLAHMLGVRRSSVSLQANELQTAGLVTYSRGHVKVLNRTGLEEGACECYRVIRRYLDRTS